MLHRALAIANFFIERGRRTRTPLDAMKLQRLVYIAAGWHLAINDRALLDEEPVAAEFGPVFPSLEEHLAAFGNEPITDMIRADGEPFQSVPLSHFHRQTRDLLERVWTVYGAYSGVQLARLTREPGSPWQLTLQRNPFSPPPVIENHLLRSHYRDLGLHRRPA